MVATARRSGGWENIGGQLTCRGSGFVQHCAQADPAGKRGGPEDAVGNEPHQSRMNPWIDAVHCVHRILRVNNN
jgi:hypothetical protein